MSIFTWFKERNIAKTKSQAEKCAKIVTNAKAIKEDRMAAIDFLAQSVDDVELACVGLLGRFDYSLEHGIVDIKEKERAMAGIVRHEKAALPFLKEWINKTNRIAWPLKILLKLGSEEEIKATLLEALNYSEVSFDQSAVDKNYDILCYLRDYQVVDFIPKLSHFMKDTDERVRFSCAEVLLEQDSELVPSILESFLADRSSENTRIHQTVVDAFVAKKWKISVPAEMQEQLREYNIKVASDGTVSLFN